MPSRLALVLLAATLTAVAAGESAAQGLRNSGFNTLRASRAPVVRPVIKPRVINQPVRPRVTNPVVRPRLVATPDTRRPDIRHPRNPGRWRHPVVIATPGLAATTVNTPPPNAALSLGRPLPRGSGINLPPPGESRFVPNEVVLTIAAGTSDATLATIARRNRLTRLESYDFVLTGRRLFRWRIEDGRPVAQVIGALQADTRILGAQPNFHYTLEQQPQPTGDRAQYALAKLRLPEAHPLATGNGIVVAVIDSGVDTHHPDLAGVVVGTFNATAAAEQPHPHGTAMAVAIAGRGQLLGVAPAVKLLAAQAFATGANGTTFSVLRAIDWAARAQPHVINMSFAGPSDPELRAMLAAARARGIVLVAAAGNGGAKSAPLYPAADPNVIAVTASDADDRLFTHASRGIHIAVAAPGVDILVAAPGGAYTVTSGTSVAAAQVSGLIALMLERNPKLDPAIVRKIIMATARDLGPRGHDAEFGAGLADAYQAVLTLIPQAQRAQPATQ